MSDFITGDKELIRQLNKLSDKAGKKILNKGMSYSEHISFILGQFQCCTHPQARFHLQQH